MDTVGESKKLSLLKTLEALGIASLVVDEAGLILDANKSATEVFGYILKEFPGKHISELVLDYKHDPKLVECESCSDCIRKSGETFSSYVSVAYTGLDNAYGTEVSVFAIRDLSDIEFAKKKSASKDKEISVFDYLASALARPKDINASIRDIVTRLPLLMGADAGWAHHLDDDGLLRLHAHNGCTDECLDEIKLLEPEKCMIGKVFSSGSPIVVKDVSSDQMVTHISSVKTGFKSIASVPMSFSGKVFGVLTLASSERAFFDPFDVKILTAVGNQLGVAISNSRLISQLHKRMKQIELINEVSGSINSSLSIGTVFRIMVTEVRKLLGFDRASLLIYNEKEGNLQILALETKMKTIMPKGVIAPLEGTSSGWVVKNNEPYINYDLKEDSTFIHDKKLYNEGIRSTISIPLYQDRVVGVFNMDSTEPRKYSTEDLKLLMPVSKHIAIALENTFLFEEVLREKREWEKTFDAITDMVWIEDKHKRVVRANQTLLDLTGLSVSELRGLHCSSLFEKIGVSSVGHLCDEVHKSSKQTFSEIKENTGKVFHIWTYPLVDDNGKLYSTVRYLKDVTERKRIEQELARADNLASLGILVAGIAHEINNPLGIIAGYSEALMDRATDEALLKSPEFEDFPEYLSTIHNEIFRCKETLRSLLEFARPNSGKARVLDINELIKEVLLLVKHKVKSLNYVLNLGLKEGLPKVNADAGSLRQMFMNVIINAMYYTPEGGSVGISTDLEVSRHGGSGFLVVEISDSGSGISRDIIGRIFDPFFTTKPTGVGSGLGLSICHSIAQEQGGTIDVVSASGKGSTFIIRIPAIEEK
jgi:two-component system NtrC family sensor kinase